ncbi:hypothetical protein Arcve_0739 [Archaeoglobus veneficus SNP6]|uniref:Cytochrome c-552/4 domain-containing protein n=2 Tax=Archaeoglobus veneficus TaxID=58290 RepID=F2KRJ2_ARCVS|nr:hypothetical protein Arcve_0739 [Archaeoglobus veneficus SNP6]
MCVAAAFAWNGVLYDVLGIKHTSAEAYEYAKEPVYQGSEYCKECHPDIYEIWAKSKHHTPSADVDCEVCHGPGQTQKIDKSREFCGSCHAKIPFRPGALGLIDIDSHYSGPECIECHNPHNPWPAKAILYE